MKSGSREKFPSLEGTRNASRRRASSMPFDFAPSLGGAKAAAAIGRGRKSRWPKTIAVLLVLVTVVAAWFAGLRDVIGPMADGVGSRISTLVSSEPVAVEPPPPPPITVATIADALTGPVSQNIYPTDIKLVSGTSEVTGQIEYGFDPLLQQTAKGIFERYKPDYGAFVALDPATGQVLAMTSFTKVDPTLGNLTLLASYPAASVFKIVTAAAGIDQGIISPGTILPFNGKSTALYKKHVLRHKDTKWTRRPTLREAFAKSINPVFGRLGVFDIGASALTTYAESFGFNQAFELDVALPTSAMSVDVKDQWSVAEAASGYTKRNTLSPLHGAMMAAAIANGGVMMQPRLVAAVRDRAGELIYTPTFTVAGQPITPDTASDMRELMQATVKRGSARKPFRGFFKGRYKDVEVGGKTGTLTGRNPKGRNDWFVGYAQRGDRKIAFAALCVNVEKWTVKSGRVARIAIESWFKAPAQVAGQ